MVSFLEAIQNEFWPYGKFSLTIFFKHSSDLQINIYINKEK